MSLAGMRSSSSVHKGSSCDDFMIWGRRVVALARKKFHDKDDPVSLLHLLNATDRICGSAFRIGASCIRHGSIFLGFGDVKCACLLHKHVTKVLPRVPCCKIWQFRPFHFIWRSLAAVVLPLWKVRFAINFKRRFFRLGNLLPLVLNLLPNCRAAPPLPGIRRTLQGGAVTAPIVLPQSTNSFWKK